ncbi:MAG: VCBS repeat-containing protein [Flavobacteriales bacterium]|nr:VCBS repeat-containing protein [Flavobacteriales bacterium]
MATSTSSWEPRGPEHANRFYRNNGDGTFTDIIATTGLNAGALGAWEGNGGDFDNDGWVDLFTEAGGGIWRNNGNGTFRTSPSV